MTHPDKVAALRLPIVLSILPTRAEIESMAAWGTDRTGNQPAASANRPTRGVDAEIRRIIAESLARTGDRKKIGKTHTLDEVRKKLHLPPH